MDTGLRPVEIFGTMNFEHFICDSASHNNSISSSLSQSAPAAFLNELTLLVAELH